MRIGNQKNRTSQVVGNSGVDIKLKGGGGSHIIGTFTQNKIGLFFNFFVLSENTVKKIVKLAESNKFVRLCRGIGVHSFVGDIQFEVGSY